MNRTNEKCCEENNKEDYFGLQKVSLIDFPNTVAATIFTGGCNMRCPYCHNPELISGQTPVDFISKTQLFNYLKKRKSVLGGVCMTGGEPTLFKNLKTIIDEIHDLGLKFKLDTNGTNPEILKNLKPDFIAMDIKTSLEKYHLLGFKNSQKIEESIEYIKNSQIPHEFRTTCVPTIVDKNDIEKIIPLIKGCDLYSITNFNNTQTLDPEMSKIAPYPDTYLEEIKTKLIKKGINCIIK